ncbi:acyl-CoA synthetase [Pseudoroseomonas rhizosphaerae]|uniref:Acyl-CoA synthetase n=1 Tax=Teichococcus rhizosphaerae TaxID=1335062 RepID=A0A2C7AE67_9PROT|nr:AMP-binding protein [Pseudoroseomonas rhizosphaerae]PHK95416.1 acyl-CoA synthetase [Pseudoroseomonas rhizosphaerae]
MGHLARWARSQPEKVAAHFPDHGVSLTFAALDARANRLAQWLIGLGLRPGDGISLLLENSPAMLELAFAARRAGLYYTPLSTHLRVPEIAYMLADSDAKLLVVSPALAALAAEVAADAALAAIPRYATEEGLPGYRSVEAELAAYPAPAALPERPVGRDFLYSSGTTGLPKGIRRDLLPADKRDAPDWSPGWVATYGIGEDSVYLSPAPLYHAAPHRYVLRTLDRGGTVVVMRKFDAARSLELIERHRVTHSQWVPTMFNRLLALPEAERKGRDLSSHRVAIHAAAPCPRAVKQAMIDWWGPILIEYYAGSESVGGTVITSEEWLRHPGSVGRALECRLHILGPDGEELPPGEVGGIWFSGSPSSFRYHKAPEKTAAAFDAAGRGTYGDLGHVDEEGFLYLSDRRADLILSGGVNVYPWEIEQVLLRHPAVAEAAVIGVPDPDFGEVARAVVRAAVPVAPGLDEALVAHCRAHLAGPKVPRRIDFVDELPRSETGKLLRRVLKERYRDGEALPVA